MRAQEIEPQRVVQRGHDTGGRFLSRGEFPPPPRRLGAGSVEELVPRDRDQPCLGIARWVVRPGVQCPDQGVLHGVLRRREVGPAPEEDTDDRGHELPQLRLVHSVTVGVPV
jgi:hypothetical protein